MKVSIIGAGSMAREHIKAFNAINGVSVTGIQSRTRSRAEKLAQEFSIDIVCDTISALKQESKADLVVVTVPELAANAVSKTAFKEDWAVLLEKPAGYNLADAHDIAAAAAGRQKPVFVGFNRRFYSSAMTILADLDSRNEARFITIQDQQSYEEARLHNHPQEVVSNFMFANSIHVLDLIRYFGRGKISEIQPIMPWKGEETEVVVIAVRFDSGDTALYQGLWKGPGPWSCTVSTPSRRWSMQPLEKADFQNANQRRRMPIKCDPVDEEYKAGFLRQAEAVVNAINGKKSSAVSIEESLETMQMIHDMFGLSVVN